nr:RHS repeat-associated core domain-containing protein [Belliella kenyensis]
MDPNTTGTPGSAFAQLITNLANNASSVVIDGATAGTNPMPFAGLMGYGSDNSTGPKAYLNVLVFDQNYQFQPNQSTFKSVTLAARETGTNVQHELVKTIQITIQKPGYVYIYFSNENPTSVEVFFDDFKVIHTNSNIVQKDDYYPFGMSFNSYLAPSGVGQKFKFNGKEREELTGWDDFGSRMYMSDLGRWGVVDPLADKYWDVTPFQFTLNNPIRFVDPDGRDVKDLITGKKTPQEAALARFVQTEAGRNFLSQFARVGDVVGGHKFESTGRWANHVNITYNSFANLGSYEGATDTHWKLKSGRKVKLKNLTRDGVLSMANNEGFKMDFNISVSEFFDEDRSLVTIDHETFLHVEPKIKQFGDAIESLFTGGFDGENGMMSLTNTLNKIGDLAGEHKVAVNGKAVSMETFMNEVVNMTGNNNLRKIFERWKEAEKERSR